MGIAAMLEHWAFVRQTSSSHRARRTSWRRPASSRRRTSASRRRIACTVAESIVYLIGAGPGNPELITVRGMQCLAEADVVLYDHLVHPRLLRSAKASAEKIDVGMPAPVPLDQEAICYLLAEKAREGKSIARLKWGDPFIFDSGG